MMAVPSIPAPRNKTASRYISRVAVFSQQGQAYKIKCDHNCGKYFKKSFNPKMNDPKPPCINCGKMGCRPNEKSWQIKKWYCKAASRKMVFNSRSSGSFEVGLTALKSRNAQIISPTAIDLPTASDFKVFPSLITQPEP